MSDTSCRMLVSILETDIRHLTSNLRLHAAFHQPRLRLDVPPLSGGRDGSACARDERRTRTFFQRRRSGRTRADTLPAAARALARRITPRVGLSKMRRGGEGGARLKKSRVPSS